MIPSPSLLHLSNVDSAFLLEIDTICETTDEFDVPTHILEKIDDFASYFQKTYTKGETIGRQRRVTP